MERAPGGSRRPAGPRWAAAPGGGGEAGRRAEGQLGTGPAGLRGWEGGGAGAAGLVSGEKAVVGAVTPRGRRKPPAAAPVRSGPQPRGHGGQVRPDRARSGCFRGDRAGSRWWVDSHGGGLRRGKGRRVAGRWPIAAAQAGHPDLGSLWGRGVLRALGQDGSGTDGEGRGRAGRPASSRGAKESPTPAALPLACPERGRPQQAAHPGQGGLWTARFRECGVSSPAGLLASRPGELGWGSPALNSPPWSPPSPCFRWNMGPACWPGNALAGAPEP